jgi:hypothetical protein
MSTVIRTTTGRPRPPFKAVAAGSLAAFAVILGAETLRLDQGHDPALQATPSNASTAVTSSAASQPAFSDDGSGLDSSSLPTTRSS